MHAKYNRKGWHRRERGSGQGRSEEDSAGRGLKERQFGDDGQLTTPVTLTVTIVHTPIATSTPDIPSPIATDTPDIPSPVTTTAFVTAPPTISIPEGATSTSELSSTATTLSPIPTISPSPSTVSDPPTTPSLSIISTSIASSPVPNIPDNGANQAARDDPKLSTGAIAGIVIGCLAVLIIAVIFGLRKRSAKKQSKLRGFWSKGLGFKPTNLEPTPYTYNTESTINGQGLSSGMGSTGNPVTISSAPGNTRSPTSPRSMSTVGLGLPRALPSAYGSDSGMNSAGSISLSQMPVLFTIAVSRSFVPTLPDELSISTGETLKVLQEFDDGWAECMTLSGEVGMVPIECFDRRDEGRKTSRYSSLPGARRVV